MIKACRKSIGLENQSCAIIWYFSFSAKYKTKWFWFMQYKLPPSEEEKNPPQSVLSYLWVIYNLKDVVESTSTKLRSDAQPQDVANGS